MTAALPAIATAVAALQRPTLVYLHVAMFLANGQVLGDETFRLVAFQGQEGISEPFEYDLELHGNSSPQGQAIAFDAILGQPVTFAVHQPARDAQDRQPTRKEANAWFAQALAGEDHGTQLAFFNGIAAGVAMERPGVYRLTVRPALWRLTLTNRYHVHAGMNVRDVIKGLLQLHCIPFSVDALMGSDNLAVTRVQDWLQAGESDYDFLVRVMGKAHVYFFFVPAPRSHQVVFANRPAYPQALPGGRPLHYCSTDSSELGRAQSDVVTDYRYQQTLTSSGVATVLTRQQAAWEVDELPTFSSFQAQAGAAAGALPFHQALTVQYGGSQAEADAHARSTQDALDTASREFSGSSGCAFLRCGHQFQLTQYPRQRQSPDPVDPALEGLKLVAVHVEHQASLDGSYGNTFRSVPAGGLVTPVTLQDTQQGSLLGVVVAGSKGAAPADWNHFDDGAFDPEGSDLSDSEATHPTVHAQGVRVRFATDPADSAGTWIKLSASMHTAPEIGAMVLVSRAQDESELPEVQNMVEANGSKVVKPSGWAANTSVGNNWSTSYGDALSVRFGAASPADLADAVAKVSGKYRAGGWRECSYAKGASYSYASADSGEAGVLSRSESFGSAYSEHHGAESSSTTVFGSTDNDSTVTGTARSNTKIGANASMSLIGNQDEMSVVGESNRMSVVGGSVELSVKGASASVELSGAGVSLQIALLQKTFKSQGPVIKIREVDVTL